MNINWQTVTLNLRTHYGPLSKVAKVVGSDAKHLQNIARGEVMQPRFDTGVKLLDLHSDVCPDRHNLKELKI